MYNEYNMASVKIVSLMHELYSEADSLILTEIGFIRWFMYVAESFILA